MERKSNEVRSRVSRAVSRSRTELNYLRMHAYLWDVPYIGDGEGRGEWLIEEGNSRSRQPRK